MHSEKSIILIFFSLSHIWGCKQGSVLKISWLVHWQLCYQDINSGDKKWQKLILYGFVVVELTLKPQIIGNFIEHNKRKCYNSSTMQLNTNIITVFMLTVDNLCSINTISHSHETMENNHQSYTKVSIHPMSF